MNKPFIIAIDGPAGSGKSTTARTVARELGYIHLDSGAMYRAVTLNVLRQNIDPNDIELVARIARETDIRFGWQDDELHVYMNGQNVTQDIRTPRVTNAVAPVAANPEVREILIEKQREWSGVNGVVAEGRDIGTHVFPHADVKIFMVATLEERAKRRFLEYREKGIDADLDQIRGNIEERDQQDTHRAANPLTQADDAIELDTSNMTPRQQVDFILDRVAMTRRAEP